MHLNHDIDDPRRQQRAKVQAEFSRAIDRLHGDQVPDYVILRAIVSIARKIHRRTEAERAELTRPGRAS